MAPGRRGAKRSAVLALVALAFVLTACSSSGYHYVANKGDHTYFKIPERWTLYGSQTVIDHSSTQLSTQEKQQVLATSWFTGFDASPKPSPSHITDLQRNYPTGRASVQQLGPDSADTMSLQQLRNLFVNVDSASDNGATANLIQYEQVTRAGGFHGIHMVVRLESGGESITLNQVALLDPGTTKLYALYVSCRTSCYSKYQSRIEQIVDSWTVKDS